MVVEGGLCALHLLDLDPSKLIGVEHGADRNAAELCDGAHVLACVGNRERLSCRRGQFKLKAHGLATMATIASSLAWLR